MSKKFIVLSIIVLCVNFTVSASARHVDWIVVHSAITPVTAKYIIDGIDRAEKDQAECLVIELDTPGGLMSATWDIDKALLAADVPVVVYVSPSGGRAASAGVFITYASHIAAMAPSTNIGAAHPVSMVGKDSSKVMMEKVTNDAVAHMKGLSGKRGRNAQWAEEAIRTSVSITEKEALEKGVINFIVPDRDSLLMAIDGRLIHVRDRDVTLNTADARIEEHRMDWRHQLLNKIADPNLAYILLLLAGLGVYFEFSNPGSIFPGVIGAICAILFLFASQVLSINAAGLVLIILGLVFFVVEVYTPVFGVLTAGGILSIIMGSLMLYKAPEVKVSFNVMIPTLIVFFSFAIFAVYLAVKTRLTRPTTGMQGLIGETGKALIDFKDGGQVSVHGEVWRAETSDVIQKGDTIEVLDIRGLTVIVKKIL